mgnify:CR=1 FL=1
MSFTNTASDELRDILTKYCNHYRNIPDIERNIWNLLTKVSEDLRYELLSSITDRDIGYTVLTLAAGRGHTELCVTLLSSLPPADRLKLILSNKYTALHVAALEGHTETVSGILNCLTAEQQLQLLFTQNSFGNTALHDAARMGHTETVKTLLDNLTPEQQLQLLFTQDSDGDTALHYAARKGHTETVKTMLHNLTPEQQLQILSVQNKKGMTASEESARFYTNSDTMRTLEHYQKEAQYGVNYRKFALFT